MDFTHFRGSRKDPRENLEKQWDHLERPPPLPIMTSPEPPIMPSTETDERPKVKDDCVRTESCVNCNRRMTYNAAFEKVQCPSCGYRNKYTKPSITGKAVDCIAVAPEGSGFWVRRKFAFRNSSAFQKAFLALQVVMLLMQPLLGVPVTRFWLIKASVRVAAGVVGVDGRSEKRGVLSMLHMLVPLLIVVLSWVHDATILAVPRSAFADLWYPSEPEWLGLSHFAKDLGVGVGSFLALVHLYSWVWSNMCGTVRDNSKKILLKVVLPYLILPFIVPTITYTAMNTTLFTVL